MSPSTDSPNFTEVSPEALGVATAPGDDDGLSNIAPSFGADAPDADGRSSPAGRVRGQRLEVTSADLTMYSAITGRAPSREERQRALTWSGADPMHARLAATTGSAVLSAHALRPWHPAALSLRLREIWFNGLTIRVNRPQINSWVRRLSLALQQGRRRVRQTR